MSKVVEMKAQLAEAAKAFDAEKARMVEAMRVLKAEMASMKDQEKEEKRRLKAEEAETRAKAIKEAMDAGLIKPKINKTELVREMLKEGLTISEMTERTGWKRKFILDNVWRIEKALGLR